MNSPLFNESVPFGVNSQSDELLEVNNPWYAEDNSTQIHPATILNDTKVPQCFETYFKLTKPNQKDQITVASLSHIIRSSGLPVNVSDQILYSVLGMNQTHISKTEFFVILGLIALAQKNMVISLENLFNRRHDLPEPHLTGLDQIDFTGLNFPKQNSTNPTSSGTGDNFPSDPWRNSTFNSIRSKKAPSAFNSISKKGGGTGTIPRTFDLPLPAIDDDEIEVTIAPEMGGTFFKYINYQLVSKVRECTVFRRYSDFYWLDEVLTKRYQFRMIPELPPKKFAGNSQFQKERLMGLSRYINLLAIHPTLKEDSLVNAFLTEPMEMAQYKRENKVHTFEEVEFCSFTSEMIDLISSNLKDRVVKAQENINQSISQYERICDTFTRLASRQIGAGKDLLMYSQCLETLSQFENWCHNEDCKPCPQLVTQYQDIATYLERISAANIQKSSEKDSSILESFKRHLTMANSLKNLLSRYDQTNEEAQIEQLQKLVDDLTIKIDLLQSKMDDPSEIHLLNKDIQNNEKTLSNLVKKSQFKKFSLQKELEFYHKRQLLTSNIYQSFVENELEFANLTARLYQQLSGLVETLPTNSGELANMSNDDSGLGGNEFGL